MSLTENQRQRWNEALASGDNELVEVLRHDYLTDIFDAIMDDDSNYGEAGWKR